MAAQAAIHASHNLWSDVEKRNCCNAVGLLI
jgi:hypothetical protein